MNDLTILRRSIRHLIDERKPADARAAYYALHSPEHKTNLVTHLPNTARAVGYVCSSRTGLDLFRPLVTMRLPWSDIEVCSDMIYHALTPGMPIILNIPTYYLSLVNAHFEVPTINTYAIYVLERLWFKPTINILVTSEKGVNGLIRYVIRREGIVVASASIIWQSTHFAEIAISVQAQYRIKGVGKSVAAAMCHYLFDIGRTPIFYARHSDESIIAIVESLGFHYSGYDEAIIEAVLNPRY